MSNEKVSPILFFSEREYPFTKSLVAQGEIISVSEPSELVEKVKHRPFQILIFDTNHQSFTDSLVLRLYRKKPLSDFWLLGDESGGDFPDYMIDAMLPVSIKKAAFESKIKAALQVKKLLRQYEMVGKSANLKQTAETISKVAPTDISTLIIGPSGSGKELVARALHQFSTRKNKPFVAVNCGALVEGLLESELFGHEKGAFTGAVGRREGIFKRADGGTVFLDEIGDTTPALQVKLLRVLEDGSFTRVGGNDPVQTNVRIVAATNRELIEAIREKEFREDLYFRLGAIRINLAGLNRRKADIIPLINHFFVEFTGTIRGISEKVKTMLIDYGWPGNVRQLRNFVNQVTVISGEGEGEGEISEHLVRQFIEEQGYVERNLPVVTGKTPQQAEFELIYQALLSLGQEVRMLRDLILSNLPAGASVTGSVDPNKSSAYESMENMEEELIRQTLDSLGGNRREAARILGIGERTLYRKLKKYDLS